MRTFRTSKEKRINYNYRTAAGEVITITPEDVGKEWIETLHGLDDEKHVSDKQENRHVKVRFGLIPNENGESDLDKLAWLADPSDDPLEGLIEALNAQEHTEMLDKLRKAIQELQPQQIDLVRKVYFEKRTRVSIAAEEGVTPMAITNRMAKIYATLRKKIST